MQEAVSATLGIARRDATDFWGVEVAARRKKNQAPDESAPNQLLTSRNFELMSSSRSKTVSA